MTIPYKLLNNRTYAGEVAHKGKVYPGEHRAIVPQELGDKAHAVLKVSPRVRANRNRSQTPALLKGLIFGADGRALSPTHCRKNGRLYRYHVAQRVLKGERGADDGDIVRRVPAAEIEVAVVGQVRALLRQPEVVVGTWLAARAEMPDLTEAETREALGRLDPLWHELFPPNRRGSCERWWSGWRSGPPAPTSGSGWKGWPVWCATWFIRHLARYNSALSWTGDVPCVARRFACAR